jgi:FSR family fosmidomycin resistance protein-like MFS transporter
MSTTPAHRQRTLGLATVLHAFTHVYQMALVPLYLPIQKFFHRDSVDDATLLVTVLLVAYFAPSYFMGVMADRFSRKKLLAVGLAINALGFIGLAFAPTYALALACVIVAGLGGSFFHPAATALIAQLYPGTAGRALGTLGIGASVGFCLGPLYAGWRAQMTGDWRWPVCELGILGIITAALFAWLAEEHSELVPNRNLNSNPNPAPSLKEEGITITSKSRITNEAMFPTPALWLIFIAAAFVFLLRDFTGSSMSTVGSLFLQKARGFDVGKTGLTISVLFIASALSNPLFGHFSDRARLRWAAALIIISAGFVVAFPHVPVAWIVPTLLVYGFFFLASYPIVEAALMEAVPDSVRGRVFGLFITIGGLLGNLSHYLVGKWVDSFGPRQADVTAYYSLYNWLAVFLLLSLLGLPCLRALRKREQAVALNPAFATPPPALK